MELGPFGGLATSLTPEVLPKTRAQYLRNVQVDTGELRTRNGFTALSASIAGYTGCLGLDYAKGYAGLGLPREAFIAVMASAGSSKPYEVHPTTGVQSVITDAGTPLSLGAGLFKTVSFNGQALVLHRGIRLYEHNLGDLTHFKAVDRDRPAAAGGPAVEGVTTEETTTSTSAGNYSFAAIAGGWFSDLTNAVFSAVNGTGFDMTRVGTPPANQLESKFKLTLPANVDWSGVTTIKFSMTGKVSAFPFGLKLFDATGNSVVLTCTHTATGFAGSNAEVICQVPSGTDMTEFSDARSLEFTVPQVSNGIGGPTYFASNYTISQLTLEGSLPGTPPTIGSAVAYRVRFGLVGYDDLRDMESESVTAGAWVKIVDSPTRWFTDGGSFIGNQVRFVGTTPVSPATKHRLYVQFESDNIWRLVETLDSGEIRLVDENRTTLLAKPIRVLMEPVPIGAPSSIAVFKGFVAYGFEQPSQNVKMSAVGQPWRLSRPTDTTSDVEAGANLSIADAFDDVPRELVGAGDVLFALGDRGVYASYGMTPLAMTPFRLVPRSKGIMGRAACRFQAEDGLPGVAYLGVDQEVWHIKSAAGTREDFGFPMEELTRDVRGFIRQHLTQTDTPDSTLLTIGVDSLTDSLWVTYANRAMVYRKASAVDGGRGWEFYEYAGTGWHRVALDHPYGIRAVRTTGQVDALERTSGGAPIRGLNRDGGLAMPEGKWKSARLVSPRVRLFQATIHPEPAQNVRLEIQSDEGANTYTVAAGKQRKRLNQNQKGLNHTVTVLLGESEGPVSLIEIELHQIGKRRTT
jgi:hypothetical protein